MTESSFAENAYPLPQSMAHSAILSLYSAVDGVSITFDHQDLGIAHYSEKFKVVVFDPFTDQPLYYTGFDINHPYFDEALADLLENLSENQLIAIVSHYFDYLNLSQSTQTALAEIGSHLGEYLPLQGYWGIIGSKGERKREAIEIISDKSAIKCQKKLTIPENCLEITYPTLVIEKASEIKLDSHSLDFSGKGDMKVIVFDELTGIPLVNLQIEIFGQENTLFCQLIESLPHGRGVAIALQGNSAQTLSPKVMRSCLQLGSRLIKKYQAGGSWVMVGYKGTPSGSAIENLHPTTPEALNLKVWLSPTLSPSATWQPPQKLYAPNYPSDDAFGSKLAISGETALISAPLSDTNLEKNVGAVYVFEFTMGQWQHEQTLRPHDTQYQMVFGKAIALENDTILIGAYLADADWKISAGAVYAFRKWGERWEQSQKFQPYDLHPEDGFGCAIALEANTVLVGAYNALNLRRHSTGAVYILENTPRGWQDRQKLQPENLEKGACFGHAVAISGEFAVVGAYLSQGCGSVYVFRYDRGVWKEFQRLHPPLSTQGDCFGYSLALEGDVLLIGAKNASFRKKVAAGAVYVYHFLEGQWQWVQTWQPSDLEGHEHFGQSVAISGNLAVVGADQGRCATQSDSGAVYTFEREGKQWQPYLKLYSINGEVGDRFGYDVALQENLILVGAPGSEAFGRKGAGIVYPGHF